MGTRIVVDGIMILLTGVLLAYASWSFKQFTNLHEADIQMQTQLTEMSKSVVALNQTIIMLNTTLIEQNKRLENIYVYSTYRTDPWSGKMMLAYHNAWLDWVRSVDPDFVMQDSPNVYKIQAELKSDLIPRKNK